MTVTNENRKTVAQGNGVLTTFAFDFVWVSSEDFFVIYTDADGEETPLDPSEYTATFTPATAGQLWGVGGTVAYQLAGPTPIPAGSTLTMYRQVPDQQDVSLINQASFGQLAQSTEQALDLLAMQIQQIAEQQDRAITVPIVDEDAPLPLPPAAQRANLWMAFDGDGNPIAAQAPEAGGIISSAMAPVVAAATLALGRTAFGLRELAVLDLGAGLEDDGADGARVNFAVTEDATNQSVTAAFHLTQRFTTGAVTYSLARANTLWNGFGFWIYNSASARTDVVTLTPNAADAINGQASGTSIYIPPNSAVFITTNGASSGIWKVQWMPVAVPLAAKSNAGFLFGLTLSNNVSDATNDIDIAAGTARDSTDVLDLILPTGLTKRLDATWAAGTNQGMRSSSALANGTWHIFEIGSLNGATDIFAHDAIDPSSVLPVGYTLYRRIGSIVRSSGAIRGFVQRGDDFYWKVPILTVNASQTTTASLRAMDIPTGLILKVYMNAYVNGIQNTPAYLYISDPATTDTVASTGLGVASGASSNNGTDTTARSGSAVSVWTDTSAQVRTVCSPTTMGIFISTLGYRDLRGRDT